MVLNMMFQIFLYAVQTFQKKRILSGLFQARNWVRRWFHVVGVVGVENVQSQHTYLFKEEQELKVINSKLQYDSNDSRWIAGYLWLNDPSLLPDNFAAAFATLNNI